MAHAPITRRRKKTLVVSALLLLAVAAHQAQSSSAAEEMSSSGTDAGIGPSSNHADLSISPFVPPLPPACRTILSLLDPLMQNMLEFVPEVKALLQDESQSLIVFVPQNATLLFQLLALGDPSGIAASGAGSSRGYAELTQRFRRRPASELRSSILKYHASAKSSLNEDARIVYPDGTIQYRLATLYTGYAIDLRIMPSPSASRPTINGDINITGMVRLESKGQRICGDSIIQFIDSVLIPPSSSERAAALVASSNDSLADALQFEDDLAKLPVHNDPATYSEDVSMFQEALRSTRCDCTRSGYSGVTVEDDGIVTAYGNTSFVGCAPHANGEMDGSSNYCYVLGGTDCKSATPSVLGDDDPSFTAAAYRECSVTGNTLSRLGAERRQNSLRNKFENNIPLMRVACAVTMFAC